MAYERDYKAEYANYHSRPEQRKRNDKRKQARRLMIQKHGKAKLAGKDVDHRDRNPSNNSANNLRIQSPSTNRSRNS